MSRELLASQKNNSGILLDPRTKLAVLITIAVFILGGSYEGIMQYYIIVLAAIPLLLLSAARKWKGAVLYILIFGGSLCLEMFGLSRLTGVANYIAVAIVGILLRFTPSVVIGYFVVTTTTVSEFVAAMERLHLPQQITIPMSVMFRFFPTVAEEWSAIGDAMRMRGVRFGGGKVGCDFRVSDCSHDDLLRQNRRGTIPGGSYTRTGRPGKADKYLQAGISCAGCHFPADLSGSICSTNLCACRKGVKEVIECQDVSFSYPASDPSRQ